MNERRPERQRAEETNEQEDVIGERSLLFWRGGLGGKKRERGAD